MRFYNAMPDKNIFVDRILKWIVDVIVVIVLALFFMNYLGQQSKVIGNSMNDRLKNGDKVMINTLAYDMHSPERYDVIMFNKKEKNGDKVEYIKRIVGLPGETIQIKDGRIYINDKVLKYNEKMD